MEELEARVAAEGAAVDMVFNQWVPLYSNSLVALDPSPTLVSGAVVHGGLPGGVRALHQPRARGGPEG